MKRSKVHPSTQALDFERQASLSCNAKMSRTGGNSIPAHRMWQIGALLVASDSQHRPATSHWRMRTVLIAIAVSTVAPGPWPS